MPTLQPRGQKLGKKRLQNVSKIHLLGEQTVRREKLTDFWPGFLALEQTAGGWEGRGDGTNTVLEYYWDVKIQYYSTTYYLLFNS